MSSFSDFRPAIHPLARRRFLLATGAACGLLALPGPARAAPKSDLWDHWVPQGSGLDGDGVDHGPWNTLLGRYRSLPSDGVARFAYGDVSDADRTLLDRYIATLSAAEWARMDRNQQFAYWVNLYNAVTVKTVLDAWPVKSIRDIGGGLFSGGPWGDDRIRIDGQDLTLDDVEHRILRPIWKDSRIHFVVNCASIGCPNLPEKALGASGLPELLEDTARLYVNHPRGVRIEGGELWVSSIFDWYSVDFGEDDAEVIGYFRRYGRPQLVEALENRTRIDEDEYDWALNVPVRIG